LIGRFLLLADAPVYTKSIQQIYQFFSDSLAGSHKFTY